MNARLMGRAAAGVGALVAAGAMTIVVVGGGLVGVELFGELTALADEIVTYYHHVSRNDVRLVYLEGSQALIADRLGRRKGHFMPPGLLTSQFNTLEPPMPDEHPVTVSIAVPVKRVVDDIIRQLKLSPA